MMRNHGIILRVFIEKPFGAHYLNVSLTPYGGHPDKSFMAWLLNEQRKGPKMILMGFSHAYRFAQAQVRLSGLVASTTTFLFQLPGEPLNRSYGAAVSISMSADNAKAMLTTLVECAVDAYEPDVFAPVVYTQVKELLKPKYIDVGGGYVVGAYQSWGEDVMASVTASS